MTQHYVNPRQGRNITVFFTAMQLPQKVAVLLRAEMSVFGRRMHTKGMMVLGYEVASRSPKKKTVVPFRISHNICSMSGRPCQFQSAHVSCCDPLDSYLPFTRGGVAHSPGDGGPAVELSPLRSDRVMYPRKFKYGTRNTRLPLLGLPSGDAPG
jgi:hypothetical protein